MSIIFKLIGCGGVNPPELKISFLGNIGLKDIHPMFKPILDDTEISNIKFISNHITLTDSSNIEIQSDKICTIYVFTTIDETKEKLLKLFNNEQPQSNTHHKNIDVEEIKKPVLDNETVIKINKKTIELFNKPNFKVLLNIWLNDPSIFNDFFPYINKGDIVNIDIPEESKDKMFEDEIKYLTEELGIKKNPDILREVLRKYNGVLNFTIREILPSVE
jgi:hypothetical protein